MVHRTLQMGMEWVELPESTQVPQGKEHKKKKLSQSFLQKHTWLHIGQGNTSTPTAGAGQLPEQVHGICTAGEK